MHGLAFKIAAAARDLVLEDLGHGEMLHQGDDIGETFVEGENVEVRRLAKAVVHSVENGMYGLVRDNIVRQASENTGARDVVHRVVGCGFEVAQAQSSCFPKDRRKHFLSETRADESGDAARIGCRRIRPSG